MTWRPFHVLDLDSLDLVRPRSVGVEHAALSVMRPCAFEDKLTELGLNRVQIAAVVGNILGRRAQPGSELVTQAWLQQRSALGEARWASVAMAHQERFARAAQHHPVEIAKDATGLLASAITHHRRLVLVADVGHRQLDSVHAGPCRQARVRAAMLCASTWK